MKTIAIGASLLIALAALAAAPPATADVGDATDNHETVCLIAESTPLGEEGAQCTRGTVTGSVIGCEYRDGLWGCDLSVTASDAQDPGTCGYTLVEHEGVKAFSKGCWDIGIESPAWMTPVPDTKTMPWVRAHQGNDGLWYAGFRATVEVTTHWAPQQTRSTETWIVLFEVPPPPSCPTNGGSASASAGLGSVEASLLVPALGLAVEESVDLMDFLGMGGSTQTSSGDAKVAVQSDTPSC